MPLLIDLLPEFQSALDHNIGSMEVPAFGQVFDPLDMFLGGLEVEAEAGCGHQLVQSHPPGHFVEVYLLTLGLGLHEVGVQGNQLVLVVAGYVDGLAPDARDHANGTPMPQHPIQMVPHLLLDDPSGNPVVDNEEHGIGILLLYIVEGALDVVHLDPEFEFGLLLEKVLDGDHDLGRAGPPFHDLALHADLIEAEQGLVAGRELLDDLGVVQVGLTALEGLGQHHLAHPDHAPPPHIPELVLQLGPVADPDDAMEVPVEQLPLPIAVLPAQQHSRLSPFLEYNFLPVDEGAGGVLDIVGHIGRQLLDGTLRAIVRIVYAGKDLRYFYLDCIGLAHLQLLELLLGVRVRRLGVLLFLHWEKRYKYYIR